MGRSIWEDVAANKIEVGDIVAWNDDTDARVRVDRVDDFPTAERLPAVSIHAQGPAEQFHRMSGQSTGRAFRQGDPVKRMTREAAATVDPASFITRRAPRPATIPRGFSSRQRLDAAQAGTYPAGMITGDL